MNRYNFIKGSLPKRIKEKQALKAKKELDLRIKETVDRIIRSHYNIKTDLDKLDAHVITNEEYEDLPELTDEMVERAVYSNGIAVRDTLINQIVILQRENLKLTANIKILDEENKKLSNNVETLKTDYENKIDTTSNSIMWLKSKLCVTIVSTLKKFEQHDGSFLTVFNSSQIGFMKDILKGNESNIPVGIALEILRKLGHNIRFDIIPLYLNTDTVTIDFYLDKGNFYTGRISS